jgi:hypothetical protein
MNQAQRIAALLVRLAGFALLAVGVLGLLYAVFVLVRVGDLTGLPAGQLWWSGIRALLGLVLLALGKPLGEWLGRGLE